MQILCKRCKNDVINTDRSFRYCSDCLDYIRDSMRKKREERRYKRLCSQCGSPLDSKSITLCSRCRELIKNRINSDYYILGD